MTLPQTELAEELRRLIASAESAGVQIRAIGGLAVQAHNKTGLPLFAREFADLDVVVAKKQRREFESFMPTAGYLPDKQFNILNGSQRQIFFHEKTELKVDIFVGDFEMCHKIPLETRLTADPFTIPLAELLLSKAQIVQLNRKDALDLACILLNNDLTTDDSGINKNMLAALCANDWGLYKTTSINLGRVLDLINESDIPLPQDARSIIGTRIDSILNVFIEMPKPLPWQMRDKVGTRVKWYLEVEEVDQ